MQISKSTFQDIFDVSRETLGKLEQYEKLLVKWNKSINLVSKGTISDLWHRHFADSAQLLASAPLSARIWLDFGSGAGFPALVCAILAQEQHPGLKMSLVESDQRKSAFLMTVAHELALDVNVIPERIEKLKEVKADIISARAVAALPDLLELSAPHRQESTILLFPKGNSYESELTKAKENWHIEVEIMQSLTDSGSVILKIKDTKRAN